ncbi:spermatogenesis-associated protein 25 [Podarcis raffonei]|uniref:spermatogenesis-associated protein 25 n=1 Tax=Podarcis raffonei TaxID=65483 RepID=UPI002329996C|nr:spermatogenesis-associated protein 25 [Podarcis raffonei]
MGRVQDRHSTEAATGQLSADTMSYYGMGNPSAGFFPPPSPGESGSREVEMAPSGPSSLYPGMPRETPASGGLSSAIGLLRKKLQAKQGAPHQLSGPQLLQDPDTKPPCGGACWSPGTSGQGAPERWEPHRGLCCRKLCPQGPDREYAAEQTGDRWLFLSSVPQPLPLSQPPKDFASSGGDFALARWGFLPSGVFLMSAKFGKDREAQPPLHLPPNICILTLAMMIAGIPTVPVPGVREEDMVHAAQCFVAENLEPGNAQGEAAQRRRRRWAAMQRLGPSCKRGDKQRKRATHRSLLPLFLAQLEK